VTELVTYAASSSAARLTCDLPLHGAWGAASVVVDAALGRLRRLVRQSARSLTLSALVSAGRCMEAVVIWDHRRMATPMAVDAAGNELVDFSVGSEKDLNSSTPTSRSPFR
jgi:hypothetical protein